jgi:molecular chaperone GrpE
MVDRESDADTADSEAGEAQASAVDSEELEALRVRAEGAERKLREIQTTFMAANAELEATRARLERDVSRKVDLKFAALVSDLLESADDLDRAIEHGTTIAAAAPVVRGIAIARERFLAALSKAGLERIDPVGLPYDPNVAEAAGVVPVTDPAEQNTVVRLERVGYKLSGRVIRPARVLVGQLVS